ncbi:MAG TPA: hypothetical protein VNG51_19460 [Ktedonobacteraceae bacterium]|nr:hypothetical protein [Ktedonobacteraceae bacterium]
MTHLIELFQAQFGDYFNSYWEDMPLIPPTKEEYPALMVQKLEGTAVIGPTSTDEVTESILITIFKNTSDAVGSGNVKTTTQRELQLLVEGQDPVTLDYKPDTILYVLRTYLTLQQWLIDSDVKFHYGIEKPGNAETNIAYADVTMSTQRRVIVSGRS